MKRVLALLLALVMALSFVACSSKTTSSSSNTTAASSAPASSSSESTAAKTEKIAFCSDVGSIDDESFNQYCYAGVKAVADAKKLEYTYYIPTEDTTEQRETNIRQAVNDGATIVVVTGYMYGEALGWAAKEYPDIKFIAIDVTESDVGTIGANTVCITFKEEQAGYLAGYAAVKEGFTKLGFLGGMAVPAVVRYGYGYIQGADAAAQELGVKVEMNYYYGGQFFGDANITAKMEGWYSNGTELVFACGGGIYTSVLEAALNHNAYMIGVDVDQSYLGKDKAYNPFVTSAMKNLQVSVEDALNSYLDGKWKGGVENKYGLESGDYVGLPTDTWTMKNFTVDQYKALVEDIKSGKVTISDAIDVQPTVSSSITVNYIE